MNQRDRQFELHRSVEQLIQSGTESDATIISSEPVSGGCINSTEIVTLQDGRRYFVKSNVNSPRGAPNAFIAEVKGLAAIESTETIRVPVVVGTGQSQIGDEFLVLELIVSGPPPIDFFEKFGVLLAQMHQTQQAGDPVEGINSKAFGFHHDNYLGHSPQPNGWREDWVEFWAENRLRFQLRLAHQTGNATPELTRRCDRLISRLDNFIGLSGSPTASLVHGDLWSGNFLASKTGDPVLVDPAVYYGSREVEFGMTTLFGGFEPAFYSAYNEVWPLADGWEERVQIYKLYHLMNHLNLFGRGYLGGCLEILARFV